MVCSFPHLVDHSTQSTQRLIDKLSLLQQLSLYLSLLQPLTPSQVHEHQRSLSFVFVFFTETLKTKGNNQMRSARPFIHVGCSLFSVIGCFFEKSKDFFNLCHLNLCTFVFHCFSLRYQINYSFKINLLDREKGFEIPFVLSADLKFLKYLLETPRSQSS